MKKHEKHAKLIRPEIGFFGRNEIAFLGAPCGLIEDLVNQVIENLPQNLNIVYVDADHGGDENQVFAKNIFQDKITHKRLEKRSFTEYDQKGLLNDQDLVLVNGNHFEAKSQIILIDRKKESSLKKRLNQLTNIRAVILAKGEEQIYEWLNISPEIPVFRIEDIDSISSFVEARVQLPTLKVLILTGGKSTRMGEDKAFLNYHGKPQHQFLYETAKNIGLEPYISCREDQAEVFEGDLICDKFLGLGPYGAILSAFQTDPNSAWLVVACDLPLLKEEDFRFLVSNRNPSKFATACYNPETNFPDPLFTIWEPKVYQTLLNFLSLGYSCPRKVLINTDTAILHLPDPKVLANINTQEERNLVKGLV